MSTLNEKLDSDGPHGRPSGGKSTVGPTAATVNNPYWTAMAANTQKNLQNDPQEKYFQANYHPPYPGWPHDGSPQDLANTKAVTDTVGKANNYAYALANQPTWVDKLALAVNVGAVTAGLGSALAPLVSTAVGGGTAGAVAGGATTGALSGAVNSALSGGNVLKKVGIGGALGGIGGGLNAISSPATNAITGAGVNPAVASGLVRGAIGAGTGALGGALSGRGAGTGALIGGLSGATSGALGQASGNSGLGQIGGTIAGTLAGKYLTGSPSVSNRPPALPVAAGMNAPGSPSVMPSSQPTATSTPAPQNIGSYSGYGYAPRQQVANPVTDYSTYGQGPEANFYKNTGSAPTPPTTPATPQPMMGISQGAINRTVSG